jgi:hypothetical protein
MSAGSSPIEIYIIALYELIVEILPLLKLGFTVSTTYIIIGNKL